MSLKIEEESEITDAVEGEPIASINLSESLKKLQNCGKTQSEDRKSDSRAWEYEKFPNVRDQMETNLKVLQLELESKLPLTQINGQRKLGPPLDWKGQAPGRKCEIFVARLPKTIYEHEIFPVFSTVGKIYEIRLMMDFSATNRGYCFIMYTKAEEAECAVKELDQYEIAPGRRIGVVASLNKCRLYIDRLPPHVDSESVVKKIYAITDDVERVAIYRNSNGDASYALISYKTHRGAAMGRRRLVPETPYLFENTDVIVKWADPSMMPSNVYEESGTCDEDGNIEISTSFLHSSENRKASTRKFDNHSHKRGWNISDQSPNRRAALRSIGPFPRNNYLDNMSERNGKKISGHCTEQCGSSERNSPQGLQRMHYELTKLTKKKCTRRENSPVRNIDGNFRRIADSRRVHHNSELNCSHSECSDTTSKMSTYLNDYEHLKKIRCSNLQKQSCESSTLNKVNGSVQEGCFDENFARRSRGFYDKLNTESACQCRVRDAKVSSTSASVWQANHNFDYTEKLVPKFSGALSFTNGTDSSSDYAHFKENVHQIEHFPYPLQSINSWGSDSIYNFNASNGAVCIDHFRNPPRGPENNMSYFNSVSGHSTQDSVEESGTNAFQGSSSYDSVDLQSNDLGWIPADHSMLPLPNTKRLSDQPRYYYEQVLDNVNSLSDKKLIGLSCNARGIAQQGNSHINHCANMHLEGFAFEGLSTPFVSDSTFVTSKQISNDDEVQRVLRPIVNGTTANIKLHY